MSQSERKIWSVEDLAHVSDSEDDLWLIDHLIPRVGGIMVYGQGGSYKSTLLFDLAVAVASKGMLCRQFLISHHGPVLVVSTESSIKQNKRRLFSHIRARELSSPEKAQRATPLLLSNKDIPLYFCQDPYDFDDDADREAFERDVQMLRPVLIVLDPLDSFLSGDENSAKETKKFRKFTSHIIRTYETAVCVIHHSTKDEENPRIRGSSAWRGWVDTSLLISKQKWTIDGEENQGFSVFADKQRDGIDGYKFSLVVNHDPLLDIRTFDVVDNTVDPELVGLSALGRRVVSALIQNGPMTQQALIDVLHVSHRKLKTVLDSMEADGLIAHDAEIAKSTRAGGHRGVKAWRYTRISGNIDNTVALLKGSKDLDLYTQVEARVPGDHMVDTNSWVFLVQKYRSEDPQFDKWIQKQIEHVRLQAPNVAHIQDKDLLRMKRPGIDEPLAKSFMDLWTEENSMVVVQSS